MIANCLCSFKAECITRHLQGNPSGRPEAALVKQNKEIAELKKCTVTNLRIIKAELEKISPA